MTAAEDGLDSLDRFAIVVNLWVVAHDVHVATLVVDYANLVPPLFTGLYEAARGIQVTVGRENSQIHSGYPIIFEMDQTP